jgi:hypothetical protein
MTPTMQEVEQLAGEQEPTTNDSLRPRFVGKKKVWIDIDNSPHVPFFLPIIEELEKQGVELVLTARNIPCKVIGKHYGSNKFLKVFGTCLRVLQLAPMALSRRADVAVSHGSRAQLMLCKLLRIPTIMMHDYEHSTKTGFLEPDWFLMPDVIPTGAMAKHTDSIVRYPGLKEDVYVPRFRPDPSIFSQLGISRNDLLVTVRASRNSAPQRAAGRETARRLGRPDRERQDGGAEFPGGRPEPDLVFRSGSERRWHHESRSGCAGRARVQHFSRKDWRR